MGDGKKGGKFEFQLIARKRRFVALFYVFLKIAKFTNCSFLIWLRFLQELQGRRV